MKKVLFGLMALLVLNACEQEEVRPVSGETAAVSNSTRPNNGKTPKSAPHYRLVNKRTIITEPGYTGAKGTDLTYSYNRNGQLVRIHGTKTWNNPVSDIALIYDQQGRLTEMNHDNNLRWVFSYDNRNMVKQVRTYSENNTVQSEMWYVNSYDALDHITETQIYTVSNGVPVAGSKLLYTYAGENVVVIRKIQADGKVTAEQRYTYDAMEVPLNNVQNLSVPRYIVADLPGASLSVNNILSEVVTTASGQRNTLASYTTTYEYGEGNLPVVAIKTFDRGYVEQTIYTYESLLPVITRY